MNQKEIKEIKKIYKPGTRIKLLRMDDYQAPPPGTIGKVKMIDDVGTIHMSWENGSSLGLIVGEDEFEIIKEV